jgi:hypothetical protein
MDEEERRRLAIARCFAGTDTWPGPEPIIVEITNPGLPIVIPDMYLHPTTYGTFQVRLRGGDDHMIIECLTRSEAHEFISNPLRFRYGMIGGPK